MPHSVWKPFAITMLGNETITVIDEYIDYLFAVRESKAQKKKKRRNKILILKMQF